jgi:hypothetical protein
MGGEEGCKILLPLSLSLSLSLSPSLSPEFRAGGKFSEIYFLRARQMETLDSRGYRCAVCNANRGLLAVSSFDNARTIRIQSAVASALRIVHISAIDVHSGALEYTR